MIKYIKSIPTGIYVIAAILLVAVMTSACTIEETCYDCNTIVLNDVGDLDCLIVDCVTNQNLN